MIPITQKTQGASMDEDYVTLNKARRRKIELIIALEAQVEKNKANRGSVEMFYEKNPSNRLYIEEQIYRKKLELKNIESEFRIAKAVIDERVARLKEDVEGMEKQIAVDDKRIKEGTS